MWNPIAAARAELDGWKRALADAPVPLATGRLGRSRTALARALWVLTREHGFPLRLGVAVFLGSIVGATPLYGGHLALCLLLGLIFRLNKLAMWLAANISLPIFAPFLAFASYQVAHWILHGEAGTLDLAFFQGRPPRAVVQQLFGYWLLGSVPVGAAVGLVLGTTVAGVVWERRRQQQPGRPTLDAAIRLIHHELVRTLGRGKATPAWVFFFKVNADPIYLQLLRTVGADDSILDVGGGEGYLPLLHAATHRTTARRTVVDWDEARLRIGRLASESLGLGVTYEHGDAREGRWNSAQVVLCIDVLHYLRHAEQDALLGRLAESVAPGGALYVRDIDGRRGWRTQATLWQERFSLLVGRTKAQALVIRPVGEWASLLRGFGFDVQLHDAFEGTPLANVLLVARRPAVSL